MLAELIRGLTGKAKLFMSLAMVSFTVGSLLNVGITLAALDGLRLISSGETLNLWHFGLKLAVLFVAKGIANTVAEIAQHQAGFDTVATVRERLILTMKKIYLGFYTEERIGELNTVIQKDVGNLQPVVVHFWSKTVSSILVAAVVGVGLFLVDWRMGLAMVSLTPVALLVMFSGIGSNGRLQKETQDDLADMVSLFVEYTKGIPLIKAFGENSSFEGKLRDSMVKFGESSKAISRSVAGYMGRYFFLLDLCYGALVIVGATLVFDGKVALFNYILFVVLSREFYRPFVELESYWLNFIKGKDSYSRISNVLSAPTIKPSPNSKKPKGMDLKFCGVGFSYGKEGFGLKDVDLDIGGDSLIALVGPSGGGKTTIANLILRFWDVQRGRIVAGGVDIREIDYDEFLSNVSIVMQNVILFEDTIFENIKVGRRDASREEVVEAAKKAMIHDFISGLPKGYDTPVGDNGVGLSGGQRQRISIARALLRDAPLVILDEMTSSLDPINEVKIQRAIDNLTASKTVVVIAHHLRTIQNADRIVVLNDGQVVESGKHRELLDNGGLYKELWDAQETSREWEWAV